MNMAFLSSFKVGRDTVYPDTLRERLHAFPLLKDVGDATVRHLLAEANWFGLPGGMLLKRLQSTTRSDGVGTRPRTFAVVPLQDGLDQQPIAQRLVAALSDMGSRAAVLDVSSADQSAEWFNAFEQVHDVVFYRGDAP